MREMMDYQTVLFDFDGVLCKDRFYRKTLVPDYSEVYAWIQSNIFGNKELVQKWMRNDVSSAEINTLIAENTAIKHELLNSLYEDSIRSMELESRVMDVAKALKLAGMKIGIVTDNMDIFTRITIPNHKLDKLFDVIINSADHRILKKENNGELFNTALAALGTDIENSLMIDDSLPTIELYRRKRGEGFLYKNFDELKSFLGV